MPQKQAKRPLIYNRAGNENKDPRFEPNPEELKFAESDYEEEENEDIEY